MYFKTDYIRVTTPKTINGVIPATENGQILTKETLLPLSAKKKIENKNARLKRNGFGHLVSKIEVVYQGAKPEAESMRAELEQLRAEKAEREKQVSHEFPEQQPEVVKNKGGRPPKIKPE